MYEEIVHFTVPEVGEITQKEVRLHCIYSDCPNPHRHLYFNVEKGVGWCHRCSRSSNIKELICYHQGVSLAEAEQIIVGTGQKKAKFLLFRLEKLEDNDTLKSEKTEDKTISLPENFISFSSLSSFSYPYLEKRNIDYETACKLGMGFL